MDIGESLRELGPVDSGALIKAILSQDKEKADKESNNSWETVNINGI